MKSLILEGYEAVKSASAWVKLTGFALSQSLVQRSGGCSNGKVHFALYLLAGISPLYSESSAVSRELGCESRGLTHATIKPTVHLPKIKGENGSTEEIDQAERYC
jgi:hypothetical protein